MNTIQRILLFTLVLSASLESAAQDATMLRAWTVSAQLSNELKGVQDKVTRSWLCYGRDAGRQFNVSFAFLPNADPLVINGVTKSCVYGADGTVGTLACGDGGYIHDLSSRPAIYTGVIVRACFK